MVPGMNERKGKRKMTVRIFNRQGRYIKSETVETADPVAALALLNLQNPGCTVVPQASNATKDEAAPRPPEWSPIRIIG
jgi:hypothetical protein